MTPRAKFINKLNKLDKNKSLNNKLDAVLSSKASSGKDVDNQPQNGDNVKVKLSLVKRSNIDTMSLLKDENGKDYRF